MKNKLTIILILILQPLFVIFLSSAVNLIKHDQNYPTPEFLLSIVKKGNPHRGDRVGEDKDTEASEWIIRMVDKKDKGPLNICIFDNKYF